MVQVLSTRIRPLLALALVLLATSGLVMAPLAARAQEATPMPEGTPTAAGTPEAAHLPAGVAAVDFTVDLGDFTTNAQLTYPADGNGPFPTIVLIPGSGPADMDFTLDNPYTGQLTSAIFRDIAGYLSANGYAVVRYNKHYVNGPEDYYGPGGAEYYTNFTFPMLLEDARLVTEATRAMPQVDPARVGLYGWSEGSIIATQLALAEPDLAAVVLQGPVAGTFGETFSYQNEDLAVTFMRDYADTDEDGKVSLDDLIAAITANPGTAGGFAFIFAFDPASPNTPTANPAIDTDGDGLLDIDAEVVPYLAAFFASFDAETAAGNSPYGPQFGSDGQFPANVDVIGELRQPVLILQGENDANVSPAGAEELGAALAAGGNPHHEVILYPGLGHSLGPAETVFADAFAPIAEAPLADLVFWLDANLASPPVATPVP